MFKIGNRVKCVAYGAGTVIANDMTDTSHYIDCVLVKFDDEDVWNNERYGLYRRNGSSFGDKCNDHIVHITEKSCLNKKVISLLEKVLCELKDNK